MHANATFMSYSCHVYVHGNSMSRTRLGSFRAERLQDAGLRGVLHRGMEPLNPGAQHVDVGHRQIIRVLESEQRSGKSPWMNHESIWKYR